MATAFTVPLSKVMKEFSLEVISLDGNPDEILISSMDVNRPGLELNRFYDHYDTSRIMIFGNAETAFLDSCTKEYRAQILEEIFSKKPPAAIIARDLKPTEEMLEAAKRNRIPLLSTPDTTSSLVAALVSFMNVELAPRILLLGDSGVGKSETAIELIKRGHRLIADDAVEIRRVSAKSLVGQAPENIRHFIELRGIGIINARRIFGMGAVKLTEKIDMVINLEIWDNQKIYDRMGLDEEYTEILGIKVPVLTIPVKPGRNLAVIIEVAAMNNRQKKMGFNAATELLSSLGMDVSVVKEEEKKLKF